MGCFGHLLLSLCQVLFNVFKGPLDKNVVKLYFGSSNRNSELYGVSKPQVMDFFSLYAVSIYPNTIETLTNEQLL